MKICEIILAENCDTRKSACLVAARCIFHYHVIACIEGPLLVCLFVAR